MPLSANVTVLTVDNHYQEEFLHLVHQVAIAVRWIRANSEFTDDERAAARDWLEALRNHAGTDLKDRADRVELLRQAIEADFLRIRLTENGDVATPDPDDV